MAYDFTCCAGFLVLGVPLFVLSSGFIRTIYDYQKGLVLTLGKYDGMRNSGLQIIIPFVQQMRTVDLRIQTIDIPKQEVLSKDNVSVFINAVVYFKIINPEKAVFNVQDYAMAVYQHSQTAIRDVVGSRTLDQLLTDRKSIADSISELVDKDSTEWGVDITGIKIQDIGLPDTMKRAMARQAQAEREKRASIIISDGENMAAEKLAAAAQILSESPGALHLRTLQMISSVSADRTNVMNFVLPIEGVQIPDKSVTPSSSSDDKFKPKDTKKVN
ncbi:slipin family protein [Candidatus Micrarchaeota archaeon]|nr:slipin family protein [Candidatus Micrarchaeota archaeon]